MGSIGLALGPRRFIYVLGLFLDLSMFLLLLASMSVKEILQSLVDDGMVDTDRIGTSNYFWAFPSKALHARKRKLEELESQVNLFYEKYLFM